MSCLLTFVSDIVVFVLKRDVKLQPTNQPIYLLTYLLTYHPLRAVLFPAVVVVPPYEKRSRRVVVVDVGVAGQLADTPTRGLPTRGLDDSRTGHPADWSNSRTRQLAYWTSRGLDKSRTGQLAVSRMAKKNEN